VLVVGLTGALGAGKSTIGRALAAKGAVVVDADEVSHQVLSPGTDGEQAVLATWGRAVATPEGHLDRRALARLVFASEPERLRLEAITHPLIHRQIARRVSGAAAAGASVVVLELPLLDAARRRQYRIDLVVVVETAPEEAVSRAVQRGIPEPEARARLAAQPMDADRRALADRLVRNTGSLDELGSEISELWDWLMGQARLRRSQS
jgi:dephospho-CoA kinase